MSSVDFEIRRGNSYRAVGWYFPFDLTGREIVLTIVSGAGSITKTTADGGLQIDLTRIDDADVPVVYWTPTLAESRQIPVGRFARYEVECRVPGGEQRTYVEGYVIGRGGLGDD